MKKKILLILSIIVALIIILIITGFIFEFHIGYFSNSAIDGWYFWTNKTPLDICKCVGLEFGKGNQESHCLGILYNCKPIN